MFTSPYLPEPTFRTFTVRDKIAQFMSLPSIHTVIVIDQIIEIRMTRLFYHWKSVYYKNSIKSANILAQIM